MLKTGVLFFLVMVGAALGCDESPDEVRERAASACAKPKPTCPVTSCGERATEAYCHDNGEWQCLHDDPLACRGCDGVVVFTYSCRGFKCPDGTCPASDRACLEARCPSERKDAGTDAPAPDVGQDAARDALAD